MEIEITDHYGKPIHRKLFLYCMRTFIFLLCTTVFGFSVETSFSQDKVTVDADKILTVDEVFDLIKTQTKYRFIYPQDLFENAPKVSLDKGKFSVELLLRKAVKKEDFNIILGKNDRIMIKPKSLSVQRSVTGTVTDNNGVPLQGVTVLLKGTTRGTLTDYDGQYRILVADAEQVLAFSYVGFKPQEVVVGGRSVIDLTMEEDVSALDEVVVNAGYYKTTERERTGNIAKVEGEQIALQPIASPLEALQGRMAGVEIVQQNGIPGSAPTIRIRGQNSLRDGFGNNGNLPLYIIDGVPINSEPIFTTNYSLQTTMIDPLAGLNLNNVESIEVLKDADATAIYGSRGANGVILITTKSAKGIQEGTKVEARMYTGISKVPRKVDMMGTQEYLQYRRAAHENSGVEPTENTSQDLLFWDQDRETDWQDELFGGSAVSTDVNLSVSGGNSTTNYRVNGSYHKQGTVFPGDDKFRKTTIGMHLNHFSLDRKFQLTLSANYGLTNNSFFSSNNYVSLAFGSLSPNSPNIYNPDGSLNWEDSTWTNPLAALNSESETQGDNLIANMALNYELFEGTTLRANLGYTFSNTDGEVLLPKSVFDPSSWERLEHRANSSAQSRVSWIVEPQLHFDYALGNHHLDAVMGMTFQSNANTSLRTSSSGYSDVSLIGNLQAAEVVRITNDERIEYKYSAVFARLGYNWKQRYFLNLTGRRDGSSRFGPNNRFANFGAIGAAWIFSEENLIKSGFPTMSFGKLRASYGTTGSDQIGDYRFLEVFNATNGPGGMYPTRLTNPNFSWETNKKLEIAAELGFFNDRLRTNISWYRNRSSNQLVGYPLPAMTGFATVEANLAATVQNKGLELELTTTNINSNVFLWTTGFNVTFPENRLVSFPDFENSSYSNDLIVGESLAVSQMYEYTGVDPLTGLYTIRDVNDDGMYSFEDRIIVVDMGREFFGGLQNQFSYKNFSLGILLEFVKQKGRRFIAGYFGRRGGNTAIDGRVWEQEGDIADVQLPTWDISTQRNYMSSDGVLMDASFIRAKTVTLSYTLPQKATTKVGLSACKFFLHAQNLFTLTKYNGLDAQNPGGTDLPQLRTITGGFQINF